MAPVFKVALIQFDPKPVAVVDNFNYAAGEIRAAAEAGCHLAVLPEFHLTSWSPEHDQFLAATRESAAYLAKYQELARTLNINIVPGTICQAEIAGTDDDPQEELRNMTYFLAAGTGEICGEYQKKNLWHTERPHLTSSGRHSPHRAFDTPLRHPDGRPVRAGMLICWDIAFPEAFRALVLDGAELIIVPSWWYMADAGEAGLELNPDAERLFLESATVLRAFENTAAVAFCNSGGLSCLAMPIMGALGKVDVGEDRTSIVDMDLGVLGVAEQTYKVREDLQREGWHYGYSHKDGPHQ